MSDHRQVLATTLAELRTERDRLDRTIELLRAAVDALVGDPEPESSRPPASATVSTHTAPPASIDPCPHCGRAFIVVQGRGRHIAKCAATAAGDLTSDGVNHQQMSDAPPSIDGDQVVVGKFFECTDCLYRAGDPIRLGRHCRTEHNRDVTTSERTPVAA